MLEDNNIIIKINFWEEKNLLFKNLSVVLVMDRLIAKGTNSPQQRTKKNALKPKKGGGLMRATSTAATTISTSSTSLRHAQSTPAIRFDASGGLALPPTKQLFQLDMDTVNMYDLPSFGRNGKKITKKKKKSAWATTTGSPGEVSPNSSSHRRSNSPQTTSPRGSPGSTGSSSPGSPGGYETGVRGGGGGGKRGVSPPARNSMQMSGMSRRSSLSGQMARMTMLASMKQASMNASENPTTGLEAIQYFAKQGEAATQKFIYCIRTECIDEAHWSPYDLIVVDSEEAISNGEHFIMSGIGLVHQMPDEPSDFLPLHEFVRGSVNYKVIRALRTFKMYKVIKTFHAWSKFTRHCKFLAKRGTGVGRTFIATRAFCPAMIRIGGLLRDMDSVQLVDGFKRVKSVAQSYQDGEFMRVQQDRRSSGKESIEMITERIHSQVEDVCGEVSRRAENGDGTGQLGPDGRRRSIVEMHAEKMAEAKHMSIFEAKLARARKKSQQKKWEQERESLSSFVSLLFYFDFFLAVFVSFFPISKKTKQKLF